MHAELLQQQPDVIARGVLCDLQPLSDLFRRETLCEEPEHLELARGEIRTRHTSGPTLQTPVRLRPDDEEGPDDDSVAAQED